MSDNHVSPEVAAAEPAAQPETLWQALATDLFNLVLGDFEWVRAQGGRHNVCPLCHAVSERDGGPGHQDDCPRFTLARRFDEATAAVLGSRPHALPAQTFDAAARFNALARAVRTWSHDAVSPTWLKGYRAACAEMADRLEQEAEELTEADAALRVDPKAETPAHAILCVDDGLSIATFTDCYLDCRKLADGILIVCEHGSGRERSEESSVKKIWWEQAERQGVAPPPDTSCDNDRGLTCKQQYPTDRPSWCAGCLNTLTDPAARQDLPTDVDTLRRLRERVDAALDEKYTHKVVEPPVSAQHDQGAQGK